MNDPAAGIAAPDAIRADEAPSDAAGRDAARRSGGPRDTAQRIVALLVEAGVAGAAEEGSRYRLLDDPALDSFSRISLYMEIESELGVTLAPEELLDERYRSIAGLAALIDGRGGAGGDRDA